MAIHIAAGVTCLTQTGQPKQTISEMSVSLTVQQAAAVPPQPLSAAPKQQSGVEHTEKIVTRQVAEDAVEVQKAPVADTSQPVAVAATPVAVAETEPDYKADYLHNPRPAYPLIARRMRYHGKVLLDVEVLSDGYAGQVRLHRSSGYDVLDNSALETVKSWHFTPAKRAGQVISKWFIVPINFTLEETPT